jgi:uncharacterized alkaline shock family protein YloU
MDDHTPPLARRADHATLAPGPTRLDGAGESPSGGSGVAGRVEVTPGAVAALAASAVGEVYGVVGLASRHSRPALAELLHKDEGSKGVEVSLDGDRVVIDLYVILEYGTRIITVAENIMSSVKFAVEQALDPTTVEVNVNVQGIRVSQ